MDKQLLVDGELVDLAPDTVIALTSQICDIADMQNRNANRSNQFKLPFTANNNRVMGNANLVQTATDRPYTKIPVKFIDAGVEVVPNGYGILKQAARFYELAMYSGNADFFDAIRDKKMNELDLSALDHEFNLTNVMASFTNTYVDGYKYPLINYGDYQNTNRTVYMENMRPAMFVRYLLERIVAEAGFSTDGNLFDETRFNKMLLPYVVSRIATNYPIVHAIKESNSMISRLYSGNEAYITGSGYSGPYSANDGRLVFQHDYDQGGFDILNPGGNGTWDFGGVGLSAGADTFTSTMNRDAGDIVVTVNVPFWIVNSSALSINESLKICKWDGVTETVVATSNVVTVPAGYPSGPVVRGIFSVTADNFSVNAGDQIYVKPTYIPVYSPPSYQYIHFDTGGTIDISYANITPGFDVPMSLTLPDMTQTDFVKMVMQMFFVVPSTDANTKTISFNLFDTLDDNLAVARDWTDKLHMDRKTWSLSYKIGNYAQTNFLKYREDQTDTDIIVGAGDGAIYVSDETLARENTMVELPVAATAMELQLQDLSVPIIRMIEDGAFQIDVEPRVLIDDTQDITGDPITFDDGSSPVTTSSTNIPLCYFSKNDGDYSLAMPRLIRDYGRTLIRILTNPKVFTGSFDIKTVDFNKFNHLIPVYLEQFAANFYVNKIMDFKRGQLTRVELIRM